MWLDLVRVPPSGTWERRRADVYAAAEKWIGPPPEVGFEAGVEHLVRRYLGGFGPASADEIAGWAGLAPGDIVPVLERLPLRRFRTEQGDTLVDLPRAPLPAGDTPAPVRFLPVWDAMLLAHARRKGVLAEEHRPLIFNSKNPQSMPTFLVDGAVAGTWRYRGGRVELEPFGSLDSSTYRQLRQEGKRLADLHA